MKEANNKAIDELGVQTCGNVGSVPKTVAVMRYVAGCIKRERERIAAVLREGSIDSKVVDGILSDAQDREVFWSPPGVELNDPIRKASDR